ncbi:hypothetical protein B0F90DRAFT_1747471 [Multifurca ochricompacta]|uniref:Uncharacterized protein n=1 Tax=Multifurca ochricompacta TaxID=376703 RepID=A0AAD4QIP0_9AGAM|nr:hypothetical protein B0F90DRAFT_1747471 [Multifurca ochricompacta]
MPIFRHDSPYYAPLSTSVWLLVTGVLSVLFRILHHSPSLRNGSVHYFGDLRKRYQKWFLQGMAKVVEATARKPSSEIDNRALMWTFESLDEDHELERFFSSIPGFCSSTVVNDPLGTIIKPNQDKLLWALIGLMDRTSSSNLVPKSVKQRRSVICVKAMDAASFPLNPQIFRRVFTEEWDGLLSSLEFGLFLRKRANQSDPLSACYAQCACAIIIARVQERDDRWFDLATGQLGVSGSVIRNFLAHGDSLLLANCTYIVRQLIHAYSKHGWTHSAGSRSRTLESVSKFDMKHTLPELQHDFCALWNEVVLLARNTQNNRIQSISTLSLRHIRNAYIDLHEGTDAAPTAFSASTDIDDLALELPLSYPLCDIESHRHKVTSSIPVVVGSSEATVPVPADASSILKHDATPPTANPSSTRPDALFSFLASPSLSIPQARPLENASNSHVVLSDGVSTSPQSYTQTAIPSHVTIVNHLPVSLLESAPSVVSEAAVVGVAKNTTGAVLPTSDCISQSTALDAPAPSFPVPVHTGILPAHPQLSTFPVPQYDLTPFGQLSLSSSTSAPVFSVAARSATSIADPDSA